MTMMIKSNYRLKVFWITERNGFANFYLVRKDAKDIYAFYRDGRRNCEVNFVSFTMSSMTKSNSSIACKIKSIEFTNSYLQLLRQSNHLALTSLVFRQLQSYISLFILDEFDQINKPARSLTLNPGLRYSAFPNIVQPVAFDNPSSFSSGVLPMLSAYPFRILCASANIG